MYPEQMRPSDVDMNRPEAGVRFEHQWTVDKHIPVALLFAVAIQTGGALWWAGAVTYRITELEQKYVAMAPLIATLAELRATLTDLKEDVKDIKSSLRSPPPR